MFSFSSKHKVRWSERNDSWRSRCPGSRRLISEALELRVLLTTYYPTNFDDGLTSGTLREAVIAANANPGADTIVLAAGTYRLSIAPGSTTGVENDATKGDLDNNGTLTIRGAGREATIIDAQNIDRIFHNFSYLVLQDLTLTRGMASSLYEPGGGAVLSIGDMSLVNCQITGNVAHEYGGHGGYGGGINTSGSLSLSNCVLSNNSGDIAGAVIYSTYAGITQTQSIQNCTFTANIATNSIPPGSCIVNTGGNWSATNTTFNDNSAGCIVGNGSTWNIAQSTFTNNLDGLSVGLATIADSTFTSTLSGRTNAITASGALVVNRCSFSGNSGSPRNYLRYGGAILANSPADTQISDCTFTGNSAAQGGAIFGGGTIARCTFTGNSATYNGGAIGLPNQNYSAPYSGLWPCTITDCFFSGNSASTDGGAIYNSGALTVSRSTFANNHATGKGGAIANDREFSLTNATLQGDSADAGGGAVYTRSESITIIGPGGSTTPRPYAATLADCTISGNSAAGSGGGVLVETTSGSAAPDPNTKNTIIAGNSATTSGPDIFGPFASQGNNLIGKSDGGTGFTHGVNGDLVGTIAGPIDPLLGPLQNNGGLTQTMALLRNSPAIDAGNNTGAPTTDQRGRPRILDGNKDGIAKADIGAFEFDPEPGADTLVVGFGGTYGTWFWKEPGTWTPLHGLTPVWIVSGDLDGNGKADLVVNFGGTTGIWIYHDTGTWQYLHPATSSTAAMADIDGDNRAELILTTSQAGIAGVWAYDATMNTWTGLAGWQAEGFAVGDFDGNGKQDVAVDFGAGKGVWFWNNNTAWQYVHNVNPGWMAAGDLDGNGKTDLAVSVTGANDIWARLDSGAWQYIKSMANSTATAADSNGDGRAELFVSITDPAYAGLWEYSMTGSSWKYTTNWRPESLTSADVDGNGKKDIVADFGTNGLWLYKNDSTWQWVHSLNPAVMTGTKYGQTLLADTSVAPQYLVFSLTTADLDPIISEAKRLWHYSGNVSFEIADLPEGVLGEAIGSLVRIDRDAAGYGWFVDQTPADDLEYQTGDRAAAQHMDLLTAVMHEMGHTVGLSDLDASVDSLMNGRLKVGLRRK